MPKMAPTKQMRMPTYISVAPLTPPNPANFTKVRSGILISASPAKTPGAKPTIAARTAKDVVILLFLSFSIKVLESDYCHECGPLPTYFCQKQCSSCQSPCGFGDSLTMLGFCRSFAFA